MCKTGQRRDKGRDKGICNIRIGVRSLKCPFASRDTRSWLLLLLISVPEGRGVVAMGFKHRTELSVFLRDRVLKNTGINSTCLKKKKKKKSENKQNIPVQCAVKRRKPAQH